MASIIVGTLVITACGLIMTNIKADAEKRQLSNIAEYVATKSMEVLSNHPGENFSLTVPLVIPPLIGNQRYWIKIQNDSSNAWIEAGFGSIFATSNKLSYIPSDVTASGACLSDSGNPAIKYQLNSTGSYLTLYGGN